MGPADSAPRPTTSQAAKEMAEKGIDLGQSVNGSGMNGMITPKDVENLPTNLVSGGELN